MLPGSHGHCKLQPSGQWITNQGNLKIIFTRDDMDVQLDLGMLNMLVKSNVDRIFRLLSGEA